ncbi:Clan MH, family M20, peptidase T-like metallopeptidase [Trichomonas vaginalis G3]|uniref:Clan MH, family M20, peptidase T-like metallopeptidase n=1 Tax=Trichomonas vaginalis (strain ATCC PRA-98 / G3) TaxID=412133 RepID=A2D866_TRIV3|nr:cytosolix non-specific dipeptidase family [Trichomonas vaginalis G3]EAY23499.1 Clan MH, family M20, peptidase T-like metallopeptidase [Trichomonas vaginalis G3]KAI5493921.1 cytosolix non-specific dipeptidase family [Trichomonas vaginalis G3]|eukprot:XP_001584485.1 Clan MH, family M20, peptidase T-like metallopeptidase [Trichomonas vaginalis G3]
MFFFAPIAVYSVKANLNVSFYNHLWSAVPKQYQRYWEWFFAYSQVPRQSRHHDLITDATVKWLEEVGIPKKDITIDDGPNVLARIPATKGYENIDTLCVQGHMDVALHASAEDVPYRVKVNEINGENWFTATETLLGADDGFATALMLLIAEKRDEFVHGPLELLFTSDEEIGLVGMNFLPGPENTTHGLRANSIVNIDFFDSDKMASGTAGSIRFELRGHYENQQKSDGQYFSIKIENMLGGHSGMNMINGRITPQEYFIRGLTKLQQEGYDYYVVNYTSGDAANVLPNHGKITLLLEASKEGLKKPEDVITEEYKLIEQEYPGKTGQLNFSFNSHKNQETLKCLSKESSQKFIDSIFALHHGIVYFSDTQIYTSENIARIDLVQGENIANTTYHIMPRTHIKRHLDYMRMKMASFKRVHGIDAIIEHLTSEPWFYNKDSKLVKEFMAAYENVNRHPIKPVLFHAGTEAGRFAVRGYINASVINIGSDIINAHTVGESIKIETSNKQVDAFFQFMSRFAGKKPAFNSRNMWIIIGVSAFVLVMIVVTVLCIVICRRRKANYTQLSAKILPIEA